MCLKYRETAFEKPSTDCFDFIMSNTIVCDDLQPIFKTLVAKFEFYGLNLMKKRTFNFKRCFLSLLNFTLFKL